MVHFFLQSNSYLDLKWGKRVKIRGVLQFEKPTYTIGLPQRNVIIRFAATYRHRRAQRGHQRCPISSRQQIPSFRYYPYLPMPFLLPIHITQNTSFTIVCLHNNNSHGSHYTCLTNTMIHSNLIRRNQLVYAKNSCPKHPSDTTTHSNWVAN